jgi:HEAT repeat protein
MKEIVAALFEWSSLAPEVYLRAASHVQLAGWDNQDVGAPLRGLAVQALVKVEHPEALTLATDMLHDAEDWARIGAAKALRALSSEASAHVLRLKARTGDPSPEVYSDCFGAMLEYSPAWVDGVALYLDHANEGIATMAALAIGEARPPGALEHLRQAWESQTNPDVREAILNAIASLRSDEAVAFLVELVQGESMTALQAMSALAVYAASESVVSRVRAAAKANKRPEVAAMFQRLFG